MRLIDADVLIIRLETQDYSGAPDTLEDWTPQDMTRAEIADINKMPTIDAAPVVHGEWVGVMTEDWCTFDECKCSVCGVVEYFNKGWKKFSYCPNCGASMDGGKDDV